MDWYDTVFELIDMRSFSNLWFWIVLAVMWSSMSHWVLGVPWDMVMRTRRRENAESFAELEAMAHINVRRVLMIAEESGLILAGFGCFLLTVLAMLGFVYGNEFSQALLLLALPMSVVGLTSLATARRIRREGLTGEALYRALRKQRIVTQGIGMLSIFVTAVWGMLQNMTIGVLG